MNSLVVLAVLIAVTMGKPTGQEIVAVSQDTLGNYNLKYVIGGISRVEQGDLHGRVSGGYSYIDPHGIPHSTSFTAGEHGFNAVGTDIPLPVQDTPEVAHAKAEHLAILHNAYLTAPPSFEQHGLLIPGHQFLGAPGVHLGHSQQFLAAPGVHLGHSQQLLAAPGVHLGHSQQLFAAPGVHLGHSQQLLAAPGVHLGHSQQFFH